MKTKMPPSSCLLSSNKTKNDKKCIAEVFNGNNFKRIKLKMNSTEKNESRIHWHMSTNPAKTHLILLQRYLILPLNAERFLPPV